MKKKLSVSPISVRRSLIWLHSKTQGQSHLRGSTDRLQALELLKLPQPDTDHQDHGLARLSWWTLYQVASLCPSQTETLWDKRRGKKRNVERGREASTDAGQNTTESRCSLPGPRAGGMVKDVAVRSWSQVSLSSEEGGKQVAGFGQRSGSFRVGGCTVRDCPTIVQMRACGLGFIFHDGVFYRLIKWGNGPPRSIPGQLVAD